MASSKFARDRRSNCIVITNPQLIKKTTQSSKRILKLCDAEFVINDEQMIATSNYLKRTLVDNKEKVIVLNALKEKQPCFDASGLAIAISFANGYAEMLLNQIINALAAANALEMRSMRKAIIEQLSILATQPESAPFAIDVATCNLEKNEAKCVVKQSLDNFDEIIKQRSFSAISDRSFEFFISLFICEHSSTIEQHERQAAVKSAIQAIKFWCGSDNQRCAFAKNILDKLRPLCNFDVIDNIERLITPNSAIHSPQEKVEMINYVEAECNKPKVAGTTTGDLTIDSDKSLKYETFRRIELPAAKPDANGIRHYSFIVEFEAPKELLASKKPKFIGLQLEAILECR